MKHKLGYLTALYFGALFSLESFAVEPTIKASELKTPQPTQQHEISTKRVTARLTQSHYRKFNLNDEFSGKIFDRYINWLDPAHNTFLQADIDTLRAKYGTLLDDQLYEGKLGAAFDMYDLMTKRRYERYKYALSLLDKEPNLKGEDQIENDREKAPFPQTEEEANELWAQRVKNDVIALYLKDKKWADIKKTLTKRYNFAIRRLTQVKADDILQTYLNAFAREIDPHTSYLSPRSAKAFQESMNLSLEGIGATLSSEDDVVVIKSLVPGAPADRSKKISVEDKIVGVGQGAKGEIEDVIGWRLDDVVDKIKGKKGTKVRLEIEPAKGGKTHIVTLVRDKVRIEDRAAKLTVDKMGGENIAVIKIPGFYLGLTEDVSKLLKEMKAKKTDGLIIDLRDNGGGSLPEVIDLTGLFIKEGPVVQVRDAFNKITVHEDPDADVAYDGKLMVMINRYSASASEIFAAAIQDYQRGIVVGQQSFGKGTVQQSRSLNFVYDVDKDPLGFIQYTIQKFYRINGGTTQLEGVSADILFPEIIDASKTGESFEDNALPWDKIPAANYHKTGDINSTLIGTLSEKHNVRIAKEPEFITLNEDLAIRKEKDARQYISLNLEERRKENAQDDAKRLKDLNARFKREGKKPIKDLDALPKDYEAPDFYLKEAELMMVDWLNLAK